MDSVVRTNPSGRPIRIPFEPDAVRGSIFQAFLDAPDDRVASQPPVVGDVAHMGDVLVPAQAAKAGGAVDFEFAHPIPDFSHHLS